MRYLVIGEYVDPGPLLPPQQVVQLVEQLVIPSAEALENLEDEKKVLGGGFVVGARAGAFILDVRPTMRRTASCRTCPSGAS